MAGPPCGTGTVRARVERRCIRPRLWPPRASPGGSEERPGDLQDGDAGGVGERVERPEGRSAAVQLQGGQLAGDHARHRESQRGEVAEPAGPQQAAQLGADEGEEDPEKDARAHPLIRCECVMTPAPVPLSWAEPEDQVGSRTALFSFPV
jgi:hypothetical protein